MTVNKCPSCPLPEGESMTGQCVGCVDLEYALARIYELEQEVKALDTAHRCVLEERNKIQDQLQREKDRRVGVVQRNKDLNNVNQALEKQLRRARPHCNEHAGWRSDCNNCMLVYAGESIGGND